MALMDYLLGSETQATLARRNKARQRDSYQYAYT